MKVSLRSLLFVIALLACLRDVGWCMAQDFSGRYLVWTGKRCDRLRYGFIDARGNEVVPLRFKRAQEFSDGLAGVWDGVKWGFIDTAGTVVIPHRFDWVLPFEAGVAEVGLDGRRQWIDQHGAIVFDDPYEGSTEFNGGDHNTGRSWQGKAVAINRQLRKVISGPAFFHIRPFSDGVAVVSGKLLQSDSSATGVPGVREQGVIDSTGQWLIPFGRFTNLSDFHGGYATSLVQVGTNPLPSSVQVIDRQGNVRSEYPFPQWSFNTGNLVFSEDLATIDYYVIDTVQDKREAKTRRAIPCVALVRPDGSIVRTDRDWVEVTPFHQGRAFARLRNDQWILLDSTGNRVNNQSWSGVRFYSEWEIRPTNFAEGYAFGRQGNQFGWIDRAGNFFPYPKELGPDEQFVGRFGDFVMIESVTSSGHEKIARYGYWHRPTNTLVAPTFESINLGQANGPLIRAATRRVQGLLSLHGEFVWKASTCDKEGQ